MKIRLRNLTILLSALMFGLPPLTVGVTVFAIGMVPLAVGATDSPQSECQNTIEMLESRAMALKAKASHPGKATASLSDQAPKVEKRINASLTEFSDGARTWRTRWDFFDRSRDDGNLNEIGKKIEREIRVAVPGTTVKLSGRPDKKMENGTVSYAITYEIQYPVGNEKSSVDFGIVSIEESTLRTKFISVHDFEKAKSRGTSESGFSFLKEMHLASTDPFTDEDRNYSAGLTSAIAVLSAKCSAK